MKNRRLLWLMVLMVGLILLGTSTHDASARYREQILEDRHLMSDQLANQTPIPTVSTLPPATETPEERILPPVGSNASLVLGASVLVLIIIGGVMVSSRRRLKH